jgi:hypothetical protein
VKNASSLVATSQPIAHAVFPLACGLLFVFASLPFPILRRPADSLSHVVHPKHRPLAHHRRCFRSIGRRFLRRSRKHRHCGCPREKGHRESCNASLSCCSQASRSTCKVPHSPISSPGFRCMMRGCKHGRMMAEPILCIGPNGFCLAGCRHRACIGCLAARPVRIKRGHVRIRRGHVDRSSRCQAVAVANAT